MWKAIEQGRVDVAQHLFDLGAEPALRRKPIHGTTFDYDDMSDEGLYDEDMTDKDFDTTLMVATRNDDLNMMKWLMDVAGCDADLKQPTLTTHDGRVNGGLNSLWVAKSKSAMQLLLSRGCDANQKCEIEYNSGDSNVSESRQCPVLLGDRLTWTGQNANAITGSCTVNEKEKLLIQHGADPNVFKMTCQFDEQMQCEWAYWPTLLQQQTVDMEWCSKLLKIYGARPNWPHNIEPNEYGDVPCGPTILLQAVLDNKLEVARMLLRHNADPNLFEIPGWTDGETSLLHFIPHSSRSRTCIVR